MSYIRMMISMANYDCNPTRDVAISADAMLCAGGWALCGRPQFSLSVRILDSWSFGGRSDRGKLHIPRRQEWGAAVSTCEELRQLPRAPKVPVKPHGR
jgi:hypothetical protein